MDKEKVGKNDKETIPDIWIKKKQEKIKKRKTPRDLAKRMLVALAKVKILTAPLLLAASPVLPGLTIMTMVMTTMKNDEKIGDSDENDDEDVDVNKYGEKMSNNDADDDDDEVACSRFDSKLSSLSC